METMPLEVDNIPAIYGEAEAGRSAKVRKLLEDVITGIHKSSFDLAELLYEARNKRYFLQWGFNTFKEYIDSVQIKVSKAQYLARMVDVMNQVGLKREEYEKVGIAKLREITSLDPKGYYLNKETSESEALSGWITILTAKAASMSIGEVKEIVKKLKGLDGEDELVWLNICVKKIVLEQTIRPALDLAKNISGSKGRDEDGNAVEISDGEALEMLASGFILDPNNQAAAESQEEAQ